MSNEHESATPKCTLCGKGDVPGFNAEVSASLTLDNWAGITITIPLKLYQCFDCIDSLAETARAARGETKKKSKKSPSSRQ